MLVLDDLHLVDNPDCIEPLAALAQSHPGRVSNRGREPHGAATCRSGVCERIALLAELDANDLEMNVAEAAQTLAACGLELQPDAVKRLVVHTEGWPVGIYLAGLSLTRKGHVDAAIRGLPRRRPHGRRLRARRVSRRARRRHPRLPDPELGPGPPDRARSATRCSTGRARRRCFTGSSARTS